MKAKTKTKALLMSLCAVLLVAASVLGIGQSRTPRPCGISSRFSL